ncbi:uncharacterized protein Z520_02986 [Fonsecaea multimorphosa CBS 102226]|uniref:Uncharacterized protein n=1 Tax=Fonsecaea multimorphosa CBS 102226 TaxID=1442371 RepID=A0A0D2KXA3_9EURO|nr:uncharacterized protein Z520_02986 [Fonsecaea multimorphosa CBS 102226]KIY01434.1 hypothetical protein Z520_02986 [Fonsecaea multimorphosa CBS 102226]
MPIGRPRIPGTEAERAEARRNKVRANVQAFRRRQKEKQLAEQMIRMQTREDGLLPKHQTLAGQQSAIAILPHSCPRACEPSAFPPDDPEFWLWAIPSEMGVRLVGSTYHVAFVHALKNRFVKLQTVREQAKHRAEQQLSICCSTWTSTATLEIDRSETAVLMEALLAASLAKVGKERNEPEMVLQGAYMHNRALQRLRYSLKRYQDGDTTVSPTLLSSTMLICAMSELITHKSWDNFNCHLLGVGALIFHYGAEGLNQQAFQERFYGYRAIQTPFLFMKRQMSFLSESQWIDFPSKEEVELAQHPLQSMLDIALKALPELVEEEPPKNWSLDRLKEGYGKVGAIVAELTAWERQLRSQHGGNLYTKVKASWEGVYEHRLDFPNPSIAVTFAMYTAVKIQVAKFVADLSEEIASRASLNDIDRSSAVLEALRWAHLACESLEYFHTGEPEVAGRIATLWPLDTAWELFTQLEAEGSLDISQEIAWCRSAAERSANLGVPPFQWR